MHAYANIAKRHFPCFSHDFKPFMPTILPHSHTGSWRASLARLHVHPRSCVSSARSSIRPTTFSTQADPNCQLICRNLIKIVQACIHTHRQPQQQQQRSLMARRTEHTCRWEPPASRHLNWVLVDKTGWRSFFHAVRERINSQRAALCVYWSKNNNYNMITAICCCCTSLIGNSI